MTSVLLRLGSYPSELLARLRPLSSMHPHILTRCPLSLHFCPTWVGERYWNGVLFLLDVLVLQGLVASGSQSSSVERLYNVCAGMHYAEAPKKMLIPMYHFHSKFNTLKIQSNISLDKPNAFAMKLDIFQIKANVFHIKLGFPKKKKKLLFRENFNKIPLIF